jgi:hypothetical protein
MFGTWDLGFPALVLVYVDRPFSLFTIAIDLRHGGFALRRLFST